MNLEKLKDSARKFEQKEDWRRAIEVYLKAIQQIESGAETSPDLSLYNRVGDLYLKTNDTASAVRSYERAVDLYADQGFFNNAIALCGKILRVNPGRTQTYLKLAQLHARKNVVIEAKRNLIEFLERMNALGQLDQAFTSVKEFADQFSGSQEIRVMLVELLRASSREDEAMEQLEKLAGQIEARDGAPEGAPVRPPTADTGERSAESRSRSVPRAGGLVFLDTGMDVPTAAVASAPEPEAEPVDGLMLTETVELDSTTSDDLIIEPLPEAIDEPLGDVPGLETSEIDLEVPDVVGAGDLGLDRIEPEEFTGAPIDVLNEPDLSESLLETTGEDLGVSQEDLSVSEVLSASEDLISPVEPEAEPELSDLDLVEDTTPAPDLPMIEVASSTVSVSDLESQVLDNPDDPDLHRQLAEAVLAEGDEPRALEEFELGLAAYEAREEWGEASRMANRLIIITPDTIRYHQKLVELAYRRGERAPLLEAYLSLGDALARAGAKEKAMAVYGRVREHDPDNAHAAAALEALAEPEAPAPPQSAGPAVAAAPSAVTAPTAGAAPAAAPPPAPSPPPPTPAPRPKPAPADASFVDLGSMILDEGGPRDTRMRIERREPEAGDEQREFKEILEQFKRGIEQNLDSEDYQAHYDLGIAFKEMGLLDEAIAEFQKALRAPEGRLRTSEALGLCFFEKGQHAIAETVLRRAVESLEGGDEAKIGLLYWLGRASEAQGKDGDAIGSYERALAVDIRFMDLSERIHRLAAGPPGMSSQTAPVSLADLQRPLRARLDQVQQELRRIVEADFGLIAEVNAHLFQMQGKMFRPTLLLLAEEATGTADPRATTLAAVVELIHLATLVHDDSVDHSVLRRGMPTINSLFSHQISVIMGDYLYSRAVIELVRLDDLEPLRVLGRVTNEMTVGEMRQLLAHEPLQYSEEEYDLLIRSKTASLVSGACEVGALRAAPTERAALRRFGMALGMAFQIVDDLLDYVGDASVTGKPFGSDLREHKVTLPLIAALPRMGSAERDEVDRLMRTAEPSESQIQAVIGSVAEAGGLDYARERALRLAQQADAELDELPDSSGREALRASITYVVDRRR